MMLIIIFFTVFLGQIAMDIPNLNIRCAKCQQPGALTRCISDLRSGRVACCVLTSYCKCHIPAPICQECYSRLECCERFSCTWCQEKTSARLHQIYENGSIPNSIGAALLLDGHVLIPAMNRSRLFPCFEVCATDLSQDWGCITKFFKKLGGHPFRSDIIVAFMKMNVLKMNVTARIHRRMFQDIFRDYVSSTETVKMLIILRYFSRMLTFTTWMFDKKTMMLIYRRVLSKFFENELPFFSILSRNFFIPADCY